MKGYDWWYKILLCLSILTFTCYKLRVLGRKGSHSMKIHLLSIHHVIFVIIQSVRLLVCSSRVHFLQHPSYQLDVYVLWTSKNEWTFILAPCPCHERCPNKMEHPHIPCSLVFFHVQESCSLVIPLHASEFIVHC